MKVPKVKWGVGVLFLFFLPGISISYSLGNGSPVRFLYYCVHSILSTFLSSGGGGVYIPFFLFRFINGVLCAVLVMMRLIRTGQAFFSSFETKLY